MRNVLDMPFERIYRTNADKIVTVRVGIPIRIENTANDWACAYQIDGLGDGRIRKAFGVDSIQAMILALTYVSTSLYTSEEYKHGNLAWDGGRDLGLPAAVAIQEFLQEQKNSLRSAPALAPTAPMAGFSPPPEAATAKPPDDEQDVFTYTEGKKVPK
jgi:hypothetical protein